MGHRPALPALLRVLPPALQLHLMPCPFPRTLQPRLPGSFQPGCVFHFHFSPQTINPQLTADNCCSLEAAHQDFPAETGEMTDQRHFAAEGDESAPVCAGKDGLS